jgi:hypothetical protein
MTNATQPKPNPVPAILVYGTPNGPAMTQASWFRPEDKEAVKAAALARKFSVIELHTDAERALAAGAHEGVLKDGRMVIGSVSPETFRRIEEHAEQNMNNGTASPSSPASSHAISAAPLISKADSAPARETLRVGARVLAAYWNNKIFEGFWVAIIKRIDRDEFTLEWLQAPEDPAFKSRPQDIAVLHPEFRLTGK